MKTSRSPRLLARSSLKKQAPDARWRPKGTQRKRVGASGILRAGPLHAFVPLDHLVQDALRVMNHEEVCVARVFRQITAIVSTLTLAEKLGLERSNSPLLNKANRLGLVSLAALEGLAVARGCWHYRQPNMEGAAAVSELDFSNEELGIALLSPSLPYSPHAIRVGAAMLGATGNNPEILARLAVAERAIGPARYVASAALAFEPENLFWRQLLAHLPESSPLPEGVMPHPTRFVSMTGMTRAGIGKVSVWIRPRCDLVTGHG